MNPNSAKDASQKIAAHWRSNRRFTMLLLSVWFIVTFGVIFFARSLSEFSLFGWTFSYYMAAQGTLFIYVIIVGLYAWRMQTLDRQLKGGNGNDQ